jgi:hypothetical protein
MNHFKNLQKIMIKKGTKIKTKKIINLIQEKKIEISLTKMHRI